MTIRIDSVTQLDGSPPIVHISDIHGYLGDARSALLAVGETESFDPIVTTDKEDRLHWADNDYTLVINGDLIDRGPANEASLQLVWRLFEEAPSGRVRYNIGNHELPILMPKIRGWPGTYSTELDESQRRAFVQRILDGDVTAAFEGHNYIFSHAGSNDPYEPTAVNEALREGAAKILDHIGDQTESRINERVATEFDQLFGIGEKGGRGPSAGLCWLDFTHLGPAAPPQIVGHTMRQRPYRTGNVVCGNVIRMNQSSKGGEGVLIEMPEGLTFVRRDRTGAVRTSEI